jgi:catechol 2,3-dioxygenase-like lactoylglutathione lyase family enzyme
MTRVGENDHPGATVVYLTDGTVNLALLRYKTEKAAGGDADKFGVHHFGFIVDDVEAVQGEIEAAGGNWLTGEAKEAGAFY